MNDPELVIIPVVFAIPSIVMLVRMSYRHKEKMAGLGASSPRQADFEARLERIEQAVDTIAIEMERIGEGQRFVTKLLAERPAQQMADPKPAQRERTVTPH
jgi:hypothetical protein